MLHTKDDSAPCHTNSSFIFNWSQSNANPIQINERKRAKKSHKSVAKWQKLSDFIEEEGKNVPTRQINSNFNKVVTLLHCYLYLFHIPMPNTFFLHWISVLKLCRNVRRRNEIGLNCATKYRITCGNEHAKCFDVHWQWWRYIKKDERVALKCFFKVCCKNMKI